MHDIYDSVLSDDKSEFEKFISKFRQDAELSPDFQAIMRFVELRLYGLRLTDRILILGNGDVKRSRTYEEDETLRGYVIDFQKFERLLKREVRAGHVAITEKEIMTDKTFEI